MCKHMADSLCCTVETNSIVKQLHFNKDFQNKIILKIKERSQSQKTTDCKTGSLGMKGPEPVNPLRPDWGNWGQAGETAKGYEISSRGDVTATQLWIY